MWQAITRRKEDLRRQLPVEPESDHPDAVKILLKLPNGIRLERRFYRTDSLQVRVLRFVKSCFLLDTVYDAIGRLVMAFLNMSH